MRKLEDVHYHCSLDETRPDPNLLLRFPTEYLTVIREDEVQTTHGVIVLPDKFAPLDLVHGDKVMVLGRQVQKDRFEGTLTKISNKTNHLFREYTHLLKNPSGAN
jgi:hypothetical protein